MFLKKEKTWWGNQKRPQLTKALLQKKTLQNSRPNETHKYDAAHIKSGFTATRKRGYEFSQDPLKLVLKTVWTSESLETKAPSKVF